VETMPFDGVTSLESVPKLLLEFKGAADQVVENFEFQVFGDEPALNVLFEPWSRGNYYLAVTVHTVHRLWNHANSGRWVHGVPRQERRARSKVGIGYSSV
jgi:hypothetical protein